MHRHRSTAAKHELRLQQETGPCQESQPVTPSCKEPPSPNEGKFGARSTYQGKRSVAAADDRRSPAYNTGTPPGTSQRRSQQVAALLVGSSLLLVSRPVVVNQVHPHRICLDHRPKINISTNADPHTPLPKEVVSDTPVWRILQLPWVSPSRR